MLARTAGTARYCYNWGLAKWNEMRERGERCDKFLLSRLWTQERPEWSKDIFRGAQTHALLNLGSAFTAFFRKQRGYPKFHKKGQRDSFYVTSDKPRLVGDNKISIPNVGVIRMAEKLRFCGKINSYVVSRDVDQWFVAISVMVDSDAEPTASETAVGVDVGSKHWAYASDGTALDRPESIQRIEYNLKHASRLMSRKRLGSSNRAKARLRVARLYRRIRNVKRDAMHKFTSTLAKNHGIVCCENLCVSGMSKSGRKSFRKAVRNSCMGELRVLLAYKAKHYVEVGRFYPSSKTCSKCGTVNRNLKVSDRVYVCAHCGNTLDRDYNASINIMKEGLRVFTEGHSVRSRKTAGACGGR